MQTCWGSCYDRASWLNKELNLNVATFWLVVAWWSEHCCFNPIICSFFNSIIWGRGEACCDWPSVQQVKKVGYTSQSPKSLTVFKFGQPNVLGTFSFQKPQASTTNDDKCWDLYSGIIWESTGCKPLIYILYHIDVCIVGDASDRIVAKNKQIEMAETKNR